MLSSYYDSNTIYNIQREVTNRAVISVITMNIISVTFSFEISNIYGQERSNIVSTNIRNDPYLIVVIKVIFLAPSEYIGVIINNYYKSCIMDMYFIEYTCILLRVG